MLSILKSKYNLMPIQVKASFWFLICSFLQKGISVITTPIFTRLLTTSEYGQLNVFNSWLGIITIIVSMNLYAGVYTQGMIKFNEERKVFSSSLQGLSLTLVVIWTVIYIAFYQFWNKLLSLTTVQMMSLLLMIWTTAAFNFWASEQRVYYKYKLLVLITLFVSITKPVVGIFLVTHFEDKVTARILGLVLVEVIAYTGCFVSQIIRGKRFYSYKFWKYSILYNLPLIPHYLSQVVLNNSDRIMINKFVGSSAAGIYGLAYSLAMVMTLFNIALMNTLNPWIYQKIKDKEYKKIEPVAYISLSIIAFVNLFLIALAPEVVKIFAPSSYYKAVYCIPPVAMSVLFMFMYDLFAKYAFYYEKTKLIMLASIGGAILNIVLNYVGIKLFGYVTAAYTTLICYMVYALFHYILMRKVCNEYCDGIKPYNDRILLGIVFVFLLFGFGLLLTYSYIVIRYFIVILMIIIVIVNKKRILEYLYRIKNK